MLNDSNDLSTIANVIYDKTREIEDAYNGHKALDQLEEPSLESIVPVLTAMGVEYSPESKSKGSLMNILAKGMVMAGAALVSYYAILEDRLTEMDETVSSQLSELEEFEYKFRSLSTKESRTMITDANLQSMMFLNGNPIKTVDRLVIETERLVDVASKLTAELYERIAQLDKVTDRTSEVLSMMRIMKTIDTTRNYLGDRRLEVNFNYTDDLRIRWSSKYFRPKSVILTVDPDDFPELIKITRKIVSTIRLTKETLKLSRHPVPMKDNKPNRENINSKLYIPIMLDMVKLKDIYMQLMFDHVRINSKLLKK